MKRQRPQTALSKTKKPSDKHRHKRESPEMSASNKAVIPAILVLPCIGVRCSAWLRGCVYIKEPDSTGDTTRKPS